MQNESPIETTIRQVTNNIEMIKFNLSTVETSLLGSRHEIDSMEFDLKEVQKVIENFLLAKRTILDVITTAETRKYFEEWKIIDERLKKALLKLKKLIIEKCPPLPNQNYNSTMGNRLNYTRRDSARNTRRDEAFIEDIDDDNDSRRSSSRVLGRNDMLAHMLGAATNGMIPTQFWPQQGQPEHRRSYAQPTQSTNRQEEVLYKWCETALKLADKLLDQI